ncbi:MAG TPA: hypothetical protein VFY17_09565 [Pilimelia sp.]|nr:hypothetical protein [Pilimelia sp.]
MTALILLLSFLTVVGYGLERHHRRLAAGPPRGESGDRDAARLATDLRAAPREPRPAPDARRRPLARLARSA